MSPGNAHFALNLDAGNPNEGSPDVTRPFRSNGHSSSRTSKLRVGVDFHVVDGKFQGSRTHLIELFSSVLEIAPDIDFFFFLHRPDEFVAFHPAFSKANANVIKLASTNPVARLCRVLPRLSRICNLDIIHTQYVLPVGVRCKRAVTIHDVLFESYPDYFGPLFRARSKLLCRHAARAADHVFTVSEYSKNEIRWRYKVDDRRVSVIHNGVSLERFASGTERDEAVLAKWNLTSNRYLLSVGRLEPRKNQAALIRAYRLIAASSPDLVLVGQRDFGFDGVLSSIRESGLDHRVRVLENVSDSELPALYRHARAFAYLPFAEGFGMPVLEAMAAGVPVIASNASAIAEIVRLGCAELVDPLDIQQIATVLHRVTHDDDLRTRLSAAGYERARLFSWESSARILRRRYLEMVRREPRETVQAGA